MDFINKILSILANASSQPIAFFAIVIVMIGLATWGGIWLAKLRDKQAQHNKDEAKKEDIDPLETKHDQAHSDLEDRLNGKTKP